jgi:hypothetical protein
MYFYNESDPSKKQKNEHKNNIIGIELNNIDRNNGTE